MGRREINESELMLFHLYRRLKQITHEVDSYRDAVARNYDISGASLYLLLSIYTAPGCSYKDLAAHSGLAPNTVSSLIRSLVQQGLVTVSADAKDRRIGHPNLTEAGQRLVEDAWSDTHAGVNTSSNHKDHKNWLTKQLADVHNLCKSL